MKYWQCLRFLVLVLLISGCTQTTYSSYGNSEQSHPLLSKVVQFEIGDNFYRNPPGCITVLPAIGEVETGFRQMVEGAIARHLSGKVERVIGPYEREKLERQHAFDLSQTEDRRQFTRLIGCDFFAQAEVNNVNKTYALVWAQKSLDLGLRVHGHNERNLLWRASHIASRGGGGLPLSPVSLGAAIFTAGKAYNDQDTFPSMVEDSFRRMFEKFPDTRIY